jgi:hypothetical protein
MKPGALEGQVVPASYNIPAMLIISLLHKPFFSEVRVARSLVFCVVFCRSLFVRFLLTIVLSFPRFTDSDYKFGIFKLF